MIDCPTGTVTNHRLNRCECPQFQREHYRTLGDITYRYCECPPYSTYNVDTHECECPGDEVLTARGCDVDQSDSCWDLPMSFFEDKDNVCVTFEAECPSEIDQCKTCYTYELFG